MVALVDANNFYVSCERVFQPHLNSKPVVVLSNNDGCIVSRSEEVKRMGIVMAAPYFKQKKELDAAGVVAFSSNYTLYADMSNRVVEILRTFSPDIEVYSIDESFVYFDNLSDNDLERLGKRIRTMLYRSTGIPTSIGIAPTKTLAKIASTIAKKHRQLQGVCTVTNIEQIEWVLKHTPIEKVWGIGRNFSKMLSTKNVRTAYNFANLPEYIVKRNMKAAGLRTQAELLGTSCIELSDIEQPKKMIATTRMFGRKQTDKKYLQEAVATYATRCAEKLRMQNSAAHYVSVFVNNDRHSHFERYNKFYSTLALPVASNAQSQIVNLALRGLDRIFQQGLAYKKAGVIVSGLTDEQYVQGNLFEPSNNPKLRLLSETTDRLNAKYGRDTLKLAIQGSGEEWKLKQENLSKAYTTRISDVIRVKL